MKITIRHLAMPFLEGYMNCKCRRPTKFLKSATLTATELMQKTQNNRQKTTDRI